MAIKKHIKFIASLTPANGKYRLYFTILFILSAAVCNVVTPFLLKEMIDEINISPQFSIIFPLFSLFIFIQIFGRLLFEGKFIVYSKWEQSLIQTAFNRIFSLLQKKIPDFFKSNMPGAISAKIFQSIMGLKVFLFDSLFHLFPLVFELISMLFVIALVFDVKMALIVSAGIIIYSFFLFFLNKIMINYQNSIRDSIIEAQGKMTDYITSWKDIKLTNGYSAVEKLFFYFTNNMASKNLIFYKNRGFLGFLQALPLLIMYIYANYEAILGYIRGITSIGSLVMINSYLLQVMKPLETFGVLYRNITKAYSDFIAIDAIIDSKEEKLEENYLFNSNINFIHIKNLSFGKILKNINLTIKKGEKIALIGESGAGKTTLLNILTGIETNYTGQIYLDDTDIRLIPLNILRQLISYFSCEARLLSGSLQENLLLGSKSDELELDNFLSKALISQKVINLPNRLNTLLDENTNLLSAGEKQRVMLVRMMLLKAKIQIFDESTSALDENSEETILNNILAEKENIIIFSTHKMRFLTKFNRVIQIKDGEICEIISNPSAVSQEG